MNTPARCSARRRTTRKDTRPAAGRRRMAGLLALSPTLALLPLGPHQAAAQTTRTTSAVSVNDTGAQGGAVSEQPAVSADGRYVAFISAASNLVPGDTNARQDIFVRDRTQGTTERVNLTSAGNQSTSGTVGANGKGGLAISGDGRVVAFNTDAPLVPGDTNGTFDAYVRDLANGVTQRLSTSGAKSGSSAADIAVNHDGRYVAFVSSQLAATPNRVDVILADRQSGTVGVVSTRDPAVSSTVGVGSSTSPAISGDGRYVAYASAAPDQVVGDTNGTQDVFVRDMVAVAGGATRVSVGEDGSEASGSNVFPAISTTGRFVTFLTHTRGLAPTDTNSTPDYVMKDTATGQVTQLSVGSGATGVGSSTNEGPARVSADGNYAAFISRPQLAGGTTFQQVYLRDISANTTDVVTAGANNTSSGATLSADGNHVVFSSAATNLIPGTPASGRQIYAVSYTRETVPQDTTAPTVLPHLDPAAADGDNGWYRSSVTLTWDVTDPESSLTTEGCADTAVQEDQPPTAYSCTAQSAGGTTGPVSVVIKRDATAPTITHAVSPTDPDGASGWYVTAPHVTFTCADATSGVATCPPAAQVGEGEDVRVTGSATDEAGNSAPDVAGPLAVDLTDPVVSCRPAGPFLLRENADVLADVSDTLSGPASAAISRSADTTTVGGRSTSLTGFDAAGRSATADCAYSVQFDFSGFKAPVNPEEINVAKAGATIPLKWHLEDAVGTPVTDLAAVQLHVRTVSCDPTAQEEPISETASSSSGLQNLGNGDYQYNWKTAKTHADTCRALDLDLGEDSPRTAHFRFH